MSNGGRLYFLDNIRWSMIVLVLLVHAAVTYGPVGSWFYHDAGGADGLSDAVLTFVPGFLQTFFMGLLFFVAGYLVPASLERKGAGKYAFDRAVRLGVPALLFILVLSPVIYVMVHGAAVLSSLPSYLVNPLDWDSGPLWFALALLFFTLVYVVGTRYGYKSDLFQAPPTNVTVLLLVLVVIIATVAVRVFYPIGTSVWNMQLCYFPQYIALFLLGLGAFRGNWLATMPESIGNTWSLVALAMGILVFPAIIIAGGALDGNFNAYAGGLTWQAIAMAAAEMFTGIGLCLGFLVWYRDGYASQGRWSKLLSDNSFAIYVFHAPVLVGIALLLAGTGLPVLVKFALVFAVGLAVTLGLSVVLRRVPLLKKVL